MKCPKLCGGATEGALATFQDPNLSLVRTIYGIAEEYEEGTYFSVIAELNDIQLRKMANTSLQSGTSAGIPSK